MAHVQRRARRRSADEDRIDAQEGSSARPIRNAAGPDRAGKLGLDVVEQQHVVGADGRAVTGDLADPRLDHAKVAFVDSRQDLPDEAGARGPGKRKARDRVPQDVHTVGDSEVPPQLSDDRRHRGRDLRPDPELVRQVCLVAEQNAIHTGVLEHQQVTAHRVQETGLPAAPIMARSSR